MQSQRLQQLDQLAISFLDALDQRLQKNESLQRFLMTITLSHGWNYASVFQLFLRLDNPKAFNVELTNEEIVQLKLSATDIAAKLLNQEEYTFDSIKNKILFQGLDQVLSFMLGETNQYGRKSSSQQTKQSETREQPNQPNKFDSIADIYQYFINLESWNEKKISSVNAFIDFYPAQHLSKTERNQGSYLTDEQRGNLVETVKAQKTNIITGVELDMLQDLNQRVSLVEKFGQQNVKAFGGHFAKSDVEKINALQEKLSTRAKKNNKASLKDIIQHIDAISQEMQLSPIGSEKTQTEISSGYRRQLNLHLEKIATLLNDEEVKAVYGHEITAEINTRIQMLKLANSVAIAFNKYLHERAFDWHLFADVLRGNNPNNNKTLQGRTNFVDAIKEKLLRCKKPEDFTNLAKFINERIAMIDKPGSRVIRLLKPIMQRLNQMVQTSNMPKEIKEQVAREHQVQFFDQKLLSATKNYYQDRASKLKFSLFDKHKKILLDRAEMVQGLENILKQNTLDTTDEVKIADNYVKYLVTVLTLLENDSLAKSKLREPLLKNVNEILRLIAKDTFPKFNPQKKLIVKQLLESFLSNSNIKAKEKKIIQRDLLKNFGLEEIKVDKKMENHLKNEINKLVAAAKIKRQPLNPQQKLALFQYELQAGLSNAILASKVIMSGKVTVNNDEQRFAVYDFLELEEEIKKIGQNLSGIAKKLPKVFGVDVGDLASEQLLKTYKRVTAKIKSEDMGDVFERNGNLAKPFNLISKIDEFVIGVTNCLLQIYAPQILALEQSSQNKDSVKAFAKVLSQTVIKLLESGDIKGKDIKEVMENTLKAVGGSSHKFGLKFFGQALRETSVLSNSKATTIEGFIQQSGAYDPDTGKYYMPKFGADPLKYGFRIGNPKALGLENFQEITNQQDPAILQHKSSIETALKESKELMAPSEDQPQQKKELIESKKEETKKNGNNLLSIKSESESEKVQLLEEKLMKTESDLENRTQEVISLKQELTETKNKVSDLELKFSQQQEQLEMQQQQMTQMMQLIQLQIMQQDSGNQTKNIGQNSKPGNYNVGFFPVLKSGLSLPEVNQENNLHDKIQQQIIVVNDN